MMHMEDFTSLLDTAKKSIEDEMEALVQGNKGKSERILLGFVYCLAYWNSTILRKTESRFSSCRRESEQRFRNCG
jgi:hypothetical protein